MTREELESYLRERPRHLAAHLEGEEARRRESIERAISALHEERWRLYMRLLTPYLSDAPCPELVEEWRVDEETLPRRLALADHEEAIEFLLERV